MVSRGNDLGALEGMRLRENATTGIDGDKIAPWF
jgi:hypothetical protein